MHPTGALMLSGIGGCCAYVRQLAEKLKLTIHNYAQGDYKSAVERLTRDSMSDKDREQREALYAPIWDAMKQSMAAGRAHRCRSVPADGGRLPGVAPEKKLPTKGGILHRHRV